MATGHMSVFGACVILPFNRVLHRLRGIRAAEIATARMPVGNIT
jgi:hypothetical protein